MKEKDLHLIVNSLKSQLKGALLSCDLWVNKDRNSIVGIQNSIELSNNFGELIDNFKVKMENLGLPSMGDYLFIDLDMNSLLVFVNLDSEYTLGVLLDKSVLKFETLFKVIIPEILESYRALKH